MARANFQEVIAFYEPDQQHRIRVFLRGSDIGLSALAYDACCLWCLGYPEQASRGSHETLVLAQDLSPPPFSLAEVLCFAGCLFNEMQRDMAALEAHELVRPANTKGKPTWLGMGIHGQRLRLVTLGRMQEGIAQIRQAVAFDDAVNVRIYSTGALGFWAEARALAGSPEEGLTGLDEALALMNKNGRALLGSRA